MQTLNSNCFNKFSSSNTIRVDSIICNGCKIVFKKPYPISFYENEYGFYADDDFFDVHCYGKTISALKEDLIDDLTSIMGGYANVDKNELAESGLMLKNKFISMIK